ncbi:MAG: hypothetical protein E7501_06400 [Ruminococcus sp.]|nr:hypothetical protein [Ruminococcus sp.]
MKHPKKQILYRGLVVAAAIAVCAAGITVAQRSQPETAIPTIGMVEQAPVIILDAGHGEST